MVRPCCGAGPPAMGTLVSQARPFHPNRLVSPRFLKVTPGDISGGLEKVRSGRVPPSAGAVCFECSPLVYRVLTPLLKGQKPGVHFYPENESQLVSRGPEVVCFAHGDPDVNG